MRPINFETWSRRELYELFVSWKTPHFNMCANVEITRFYSALKKADRPFTPAVMYVLACAANQIVEFRYRIINGKVYEYEVVHPSSTILTEDELFSFCTVEYTSDFATFVERAASCIKTVKERPTLENEPGQHNLLYMSVIPWVSFTSFMHPLDIDPVDSVPRFAWGKYFWEGDKLKLPLSVQGHHALMDGLHVGKYYQLVQKLFDNPEYVC